MTSTSENILLAIGHCLVAAILIFPVWYVDIVPMPDFPAHMARIHTLSVLGKDPHLSEMYQAKWEFLPNVAVDAFVLTAMRFMPLITAGKLFVTVSIILWMAGTAWLHRTLAGRWSVIPLFAAPFVLNAAFFFGFLNYSASAGISIIGLAVWASTASQKPALRLVCVMPFLLLAYFTHIMGFFILACSMLGYELGLELASTPMSLKRGIRRLVPALAAILPVVAIFVFLTPHAGQEGEWRFGTVAQAVANFKYAISLDIDRAFYAAFAILLLLGGAGLVFRKISIDRRMSIVLAGLGLGALLSPLAMLGGNIVQVRLPPVVGCLGIASLHDTLGRGTKIFAAAVLGILLVYRAVVVTETWEAYDRDYKELAAAAATIEPGSKIFLVQLRSDEASAFAKTLTYSHFLDLVSVRQGLFTPMIFAWPSQHPLRTTPAYRNLAARSSYQGVAADPRDLPTLASGAGSAAAERFPYLVRWQCHFDYVLAEHLSEFENPMPSALERRQAGSYFTLYKVIADRTDCPGKTP